MNVHTRWFIFFDDMLTKIMKVPAIIVSFMKLTMKRRLQKATYIVGIGRHSDEEVHAMLIKDLRKFSDILGEKTV